MRLSFYSGLAVAMIAADTATKAAATSLETAQVNSEEDNLALTQSDIVS